MTFSLILKDGVYTELQIDDGASLQVFPLEEISSNLPIRLVIKDKEGKFLRRYKLVQE